MRRRAFVQALAATAALRLPGAAAQRPPPRRGPAQRIVVVGAGLAGLCAAYELDRAGHEVVVLEAARRAGGRVRTERGFADGLHADVGALYIPDTHPLPLQYVRQFDLPLDPQLPSGLLPVRLLRGERFVLTPDRLQRWPYALDDEERALGYDGLAERYEQPLVDAVGDPTAADWPPAAALGLDRLSLPEALRARGASAEAAALLCAGWSDLWGEGADSVSALAVMRDLALQTGATQNYRIRGGNDLLPLAFAQRLAARIHYGAEVRAIADDGRRVRVAFTAAGAQQEMLADRLVCAIPYSVLRGLQLPAQWSAGKRRAIDALPYFSATRITLQMRERFWLADGESGAAQTDLGTISAVFDMSAAQPGPRGLLQTYSGGAAARALAALDDAPALDAALAALARVFPDARRHCEGGTVQRWDAEPYARGASCWFRPGQLAELAPHLARAEGRVHFAGDHTSPWIRWMQGALHSGLRVAREIDDSR